MRDPNILADAGRSNLHGIKPEPLFVRLHPERRNVVTREALIYRIRGEFREMRGLSLTLSQAARLFGISQEICARLLLGLAKDGFLRLTVDGCYILRGENP